MPLYGYRCESCGSKTEIMCSFTAKGDKAKSLVCERCGGKRFSEVYGLAIGSGSGRSIPDMNGAPVSGGCSSCAGGSCGGGCC